MNHLSKLLFAAALLLGLVGVGVAVVQPGDLGGDSSTEAAQVDDTSTSTTEAPPSSTTSSSTTTSSTTTTADSGEPEGDEGNPAVGGDTGSPASDGDSTVDGTGGDQGPSVGGGSGLAGGDDTADDLDDGLAATGGTSTVGLALAAAAAGLALRRRSAGDQRSHG